LNVVWLILGSIFLELAVVIASMIVAAALLINGLHAELIRIQ
tara:strand:- start:711 stop:836 length:126 start_codon:yes stop_codon:yes gene_type:complete